jgi:hypothetical protein
VKFIVEVPTYVRVEVDARNADDAAAAAHALIEKCQHIDLLHGGAFVEETGILRDARVTLLDPDEDRAPDVYVCRGGKLFYVNDVGHPESLDEDCPIGISLPD